MAARETMEQLDMEPVPLSVTGRSALEVSIDAARRAGEVIRERFLTDKEVRFKGRADIVTDVDLAAEKVILDLVQSEFPPVQHSLRGVQPHRERVALYVGNRPHRRHP